MIRGKEELKIWLIKGRVAKMLEVIIVVYRPKKQARLQRHGNGFFPSTTHCLTLASILVLSFLTKNIHGLTISPETINDLHSLSDGSNSPEDYKEHAVDDDEISETTGYQPLDQSHYNFLEESSNEEGDEYLQDSNPPASSVDFEAIPYQALLPPREQRGSSMYLRTGRAANMLLRAGKRSLQSSNEIMNNEDSEEADSHTENETDEKLKRAQNMLLRAGKRSNMLLRTGRSDMLLRAGRSNMLLRTGRGGGNTMLLRAGKRGGSTMYLRAGKRSHMNLYDLLPLYQENGILPKMKKSDMILRAGKRQRGNMYLRAGKRSIPRTKKEGSMYLRAGKRARMYPYSNYQSEQGYGKRVGNSMLLRAGKRAGDLMYLRAGRAGNGMYLRAGK